MAKSICLFNHKGGVSKTTTAFNLGWILAEKGKKVIIVDLDSQCNLTGLVLGYDAIDENTMDVFYNSRDNLTMKTIVEDLISGLPPELSHRNDTSKIHKTKHNKLQLLPGHIDIAELDSQISVSLKIASGIPATKNIPGNLPALLQKIAKRENADYMLYDLSPNVGGLNEVALMSSDFFIVPTSPDYFCLQAIGSLSKNIVKWHKEIKRFKEDNGFDNNDYSIANKPKFLGAIQQRYRPRNDKPATSFQQWIDKIREAINNKLVPALDSIDCVIEREKVEKALAGSEFAPYDLAHISDFNSLIAISQQLSKPIFSLSDDEIKNTGRVFGHAELTMTGSRDNFLKAFEALGDRVIALTR
ncbi:ParA family protein [Megalodesulfovibrio gigas]|uniref:Putative chromosome partitioning ATPase Soj n=1 Tax=Megalodesulfovibrio gigas (strain ATCC 19364 / DSM 1382 / NCIMB 9332 / VKM B-1759) TaxID=1121448 RepID=T2GB73_MEGG1|nr:AAA family ATPase [Megalodesulfovibrio gigas]AGW13142.1 putative chromosome partitioning ATPase Soj [Megalodesulfovibrio gigas DSM 1382 = ATCC 19364]